VTDAVPDRDAGTGYRHASAANGYASAAYADIGSPSGYASAPA